ncbi:ATP binding protein putative isoform 1 [Tripterygium wilfordii]|uniref:ATP binding protein putative isoform 1 n=1 Tax=Tripterygium wilfordii TaxID=458696 RepID=A0A7J7DJJ8_TRIWF|nr:ATP binding protein putative isoform 1 [Tripterygium wilfordii]
MLLSAIIPQTSLSNPNSNPNSNNIYYTSTSSIFLSHENNSLRPHNTSRKPVLPINASSSVTSNGNETSLQNSSSREDRIRHVTHTLCDEEPEGGGTEVSSAAALAAAIRRASTSPVEFSQNMEKDPKGKLVLPSSDFQKLCVEQLDLFRRTVDPNVLLSVYVRPAGSYVMDRLELRRVTTHPSINAADIVILIGNFGIPTGLRAAEAALSSKKVEVILEHRAAVFTMVKHPFVVGFLVAELPMMEKETSQENALSKGADLFHCPAPEEAYDLAPKVDKKPWEIQAHKDETLRMSTFTMEQKLNAINISCSLAMAYVMDQKAMLLQQSSWQNNVRMSNLVEQIRGPLSSIQTMSKMLSIQTKRSEIAHDIVKDILVQGDRIRDTLQELQDAVNILHYNEDTLTKMRDSTHAQPDSLSSQSSDNFSMNSFSNKLQSSGKPLSLNAATKDLEMPMPPLALAPLKQNGIRPCNVSDVLSDLVDAVRPLAGKQQRVVELSELSQCSQVALEEPDLRQALSNLIEGALLRTQIGGKVDIVSTAAPAGGALVLIDDDGPDMHYMTQMHSLKPFGAELFSENRLEDNMTWNFVAGLTVAREILESYGCVVRVISPRFTDAALGTGGTRIELWLPSFST